VTEPFDWAQVTHAAQNWMDTHDEAPLWLIVPPETTDEIMDLAEEIYDTPVVRSKTIEVPYFTAIAPAAPKPSAMDLTRGPIFTPNPAVVARSKLIQRAKEGRLTTAEIQQMSMEDYAAVRGYLLAQMEAATKGKSFGEVFGKFTDITES